MNILVAFILHYNFSFSLLQCKMIVSDRKITVHQITFFFQKIKIFFQIIKIFFEKYFI